MIITASDVVTVLWTFVVAFGLFSVTIFVHELGHFIAAKRFGLVVQKFAIGMGPKIWSFKYNGVEYAINWLPLGGFVQLPQMTAMEMIEGDSEFDPKTLPPVSPWARLWTAFFGPLFSIGLAFVLACMVYWIGIPDKKLSSMTIGYVEPASPASKAGIQPGDKIISINGQKIKQWGDGPNSVISLILLNPDKSLHLETERNGEALKYDLVPEKNPEMENLRTLGFEQYPFESLIVNSVMPNRSAEKAGLQKGDEIISANGVKVFNRQQFSNIVKKSTSAFPIEYLRNGQTFSATVEATRTSPDSPPLIGIEWKQPEPIIIHPSPIKQIADSSTIVFRTLRALTSPSSGVGLRHMSGPLGIYDRLMNLIKIDPRLLLAFMVVLNVNLAILNLLPIPVLDGGHITLCLLEMIRKKPLEPKIVQGMFTVCFVLLISMILYTGFFDALRIGKRFNKDQEAAQAISKLKSGTPTTPQP